MIQGRFCGASAMCRYSKYFRTGREQFLCRELDLSNIKALNRQLTAWVEESYTSLLPLHELERDCRQRAHQVASDTALGFAVLALGLPLRENLDDEVAPGAGLRFFAVGP